MPADRLGPTATLSPDERAHVDACPACGSEARWAAAADLAEPLFAGRYAVAGRLGSGGMAEVLGAVDRTTGERVAIKRLALLTDTDRARFGREVAAQQRVRHPNVLAVLAVVPPDAVILPLARGPHLGALVGVGSPIGLGQRLALFRELVGGVAAIHAAGLVHRDLKPSNVLIDATDGEARVLVADFGLARGNDDPALTRTGHGLGTPAYQAPEQRTDAARADARADVYALGAVLAELLTGARAAPAGADPWSALARRMTALAPADRPADARAVLDALPPTEPLDHAALVPLCRARAPALADPCADDGPQEPPANLPIEHDAFVGRAADLAALAHAVDRSPLVTITGPGGIGKTRLALRHAALWRDAHPGGVWFCDLADARDASGVAIAVARGLAVPLTAGDPIVQLGYALGARGRCLVVLDNFEQVAPFAGATVGRWLERAADARFVATSRQPLGLPAERVLPLDRLSDGDATALFVRRAREVLPQLLLSPADDDAIAGLVALLDGLPLALELAAARIRVMSAPTLLARMDARFRVLAAPSGRRDRHATLRAALDWSWDLLDADDRQALARLAVFRSGGAVDAAGAVLGVQPDAAAERIAGLVARSLVRPSDGGRFDLLLSVQAYGEERLSPEARADAERRHGAFFARYGEDASLRDMERDGRQGRNTLARDLDNIVAACHRAIARGDGAVAVPCLAAASAVFEVRGPFSAGLALADAVADAVAGAGLSLTDAQRGRVERWAGLLASCAGRSVDSEARLERAAALARAAGDRRLEAVTLVTLAGLVGPERAAALHAEAVDAARAVGEPELEGMALGNQALRVALRAGRLEDARATLERGLALVRSVGQSRFEGVLLGHLGHVHAQLGSTDEADRTYRAALAIHRAHGHRRFEGIALAMLGGLNVERGRPDDAERYLLQARAVHREVGNAPSEAVVLTYLGNLALDRSRVDEARAHYAAALAIHEAFGDGAGRGIVLTNLGALLGLYGDADEAIACLREALACNRAARNRRFEGMVQVNLGAVLAKRGDGAAAQPHLEAALDVAREVGDRRLEGAALGLLGEVMLARADVAAARARFADGEAVLRAGSFELELAKLLAARVHADQASGDLDAARAALDEAERFSDATASGPTTELGLALARARGALAPAGPAVGT